MEVWFYHLTAQPLEKALPILLERSIERGWTAVVQMATQERVTALDEFLWTYAEESFLAHGTAADGDAELQHVYLTTGPENPNGAEVRFFVEGAQIAPVLAAGGDPYERVILMFDGNNDAELQAARLQWKELKAQGLELSYWQQGENGGWQKKD
jgi:DNA polymerase-3 subunit chi